MHALAHIAAAALTASALAGCAPRPAWDPRALGDLNPPVLVATQSDASGALELRFDEVVALVAGSLVLEPALAVSEARAVGTSLVIAAAAQVPGQEYRLEATVQDAQGNSAAVIVRFYGFNAEVPRLLLNEFTPRGSTEHPDLVEIRVLSDGDLAGVVLYQGTPSDWTDRTVFPACRVRAGEYALVHFRPSGSADERNETTARDASGGADAGATAWDFWVAGGQGLSGNNGVLSLYDRPGGLVLDGVLYSIRTSDSDTAYGGFGSASMQARARELVRHGGWIAGSGEVRPEDALSPDGATATRTIARSSSSVDTNGREDWHITPTRGSTWGAENTDECYVPPPPARQR